MKVYLAALGSLVAGAIVLASIFVIGSALTDDDDASDSSTATLPGVPITTASTNEDGSAFFDGEEIEVRVHDMDGTALEGVTVHYLDGAGYELFIAEDSLGRFLPSWAFFTHASPFDLTTRAAGLVEVEPGTDQFNAMVRWIEDVRANVDVRRCMTGEQLADESDTRVVLASATLSFSSSLLAGVGAVSHANRLVANNTLGVPSEAFFDVFEFDLEGISTTIRHYEALGGGDCRPELAADDTPVLSATPRPGQPTATPLPEGPTDTPEPDQPTDTPVPLPTDTPQSRLLDTPRPASTVAPVEADFLRITDVEPPLGTTITERTIISVTVEYRVSSVDDVSISGLADMNVNLLSIGIYSPADTQGTLKLSGEQFNSSEARLCAVSITMERLTLGGGEQLASDSRGYTTPAC